MNQREYFCVVNESTIYGVGEDEYEAADDAIKSINEIDNDVYDENVQTMVVASSHDIKKDILENDGHRYGFRIKRCSKDIYHEPKKLIDRELYEDRGVINEGNNDSVEEDNSNFEMDCIERARDIRAVFDGGWAK